MRLSPPLQSLARVFKIPFHSTYGRPLAHVRPNITQISSFSTTLHRNAKKIRRPDTRNQGPPGKIKGPIKPDRRITLIRYHLRHPKNPRPLRFSRLRHLRHWTIHRAAMLYREQQRRQQQLELERQYNAMRDACEELRVGAGDGGRLYRQAMIRKGIFGGKPQSAYGFLGGNGGIPVEYARFQTEGPSMAVWDEEWTRG